MIYVVLGMHKSGTTLVSQTLHKSGVSMGSEFDEAISYDQGNQWERRASFLVNLDIVGADEITYYSLDNFTPHPPPLLDSNRAAMQALVDDAERTGGDWGFKDPLTCLTYAQWRLVLPPHRLVCVYRGPEEVMRHYRVRPFDPLHARRVLRAWSRYNEGVLHAIAQPDQPSVLIRYESLMRDDAEFARLRAFVGRDLVDMRRPSQHRARRGHPLFGPVGRTMRLLGDPDPQAVLARLDAVRASQPGTVVPL